MNKKIEYTDEPMEFSIINDFLPYIDEPNKLTIAAMKEARKLKGEVVTLEDLANEESFNI